MNKHRFVWHDLNTKDLEGSTKFYGELFDWTFEGEGYLHIKAGDEMIGGIRQLAATESQPTSWLGYLGVDDVAATVTSITGHGGRVFMPTTKLENVGTFAVTADPTGAVFAPWTSARAGEDVERTELPKPSTFCWDELVSTDPKAAVAFYEKVFGWQGRALDMGNGTTYTLLDRPGVTNPKGEPQSAGGVMQSPPGVPHSYWIAYVGVDKCNKVAVRAKELGAEIMVGPQDIPNVGRFACFTDPQGASLAILQPR